MVSSDFLQIPIGTVTDDFFSNGQTIKDTALIDLINKIQMYYGEADISVTSPLSSTARISKGTVKVGDIYSIYTYTNFLVTITITGAQLRRYLEFSVKYYKTFESGDIKINKNNIVQEYNLDILQGADYIVDLTKTGLFDAKGALIPGGQPRITKLTFRGREIYDDQVFKLAMNSYRFNGGGGFLAAAGIKPQSTDPKAINYITVDSQKTFGDEGQICKLIIKYFQDMATEKIISGKTSVEPSCDNNWRLMPCFYDFMHLSDLHGEINNTPTSGTPRINAALISGAVNMERETYGDERTILLAAGDMMEGAAISNILKGKPIIDIMNQMKFDLTELGNHDFDWGMDVLNRNIANAKFTFLVANMSLKQGDTDKNSIEFINTRKPWIILNKDGFKIGVIGIIHPNTENIVPSYVINHFSFQDPVAIVNALVPQVKAAGADIVIVVAHIGDQYNYWPTTGPQPEKKPLSQDLARLAQGVSGVAAIFGGNSHTINYDLVPDVTGTFIPAVVGTSKGISVIRLAIDENNKVISATPGYLDIYNRLYSTLTPDPAVQNLVDEANQEMGSILNQIICRAEVNMTRSTASSGNLDSNLGNWAADIIRNTGKADFGFINSGALRKDIPRGNITIGDIWTLMPFENQINVMDMTGAQIKTVLEYMVSGIKNKGHIAGLRFTFDPDKPARFYLNNDGKLIENPNNNRVMWISLSDGTPIDMSKTYKVATSDFIATGGDYYPFPSNSANLVTTHILVRDAMLVDLKTRETLKYLSDGRIQFGMLSTYQIITPDFSNIISNHQVTKEFEIKPVSVGNTGYFKARVNIIINKPSDAKVEMLAYDQRTNKYYNAATLGYWGSKDGIPITPDFNEKISFRFNFSHAGPYTIRYVLVDLNTNQEIVSESCNLLVINAIPTIKSNLETYVIKDEKTNFINIEARDYIGKPVRVKISLTNPELHDKIELKYFDETGKDYDIKFDKYGVAWFGPLEGFALADIKNLLQAKFKKATIFELKLEIVQLEILASEIETITVIED